MVDHMWALFHDFTFALRQLRQHRVYALTAILSMALGIGATAAVYSVLYGVLVDPYPYRDAAHLAFINLYDKAGHAQGDFYFTPAEIDQLRTAKSVSEIMAHRDVTMTSTEGDLPLTTKVLEVSGNTFQFLGAPPIMGRTFTAAETPE